MLVFTMHTTYITYDLQPICNVRHDTCTFGSMPNSSKTLTGKRNTKPPLYVFFLHFKVYFKKKNKIIMPFGLQVETKNV